MYEDGEEGGGGQGDRGRLQGVLEFCIKFCSITSADVWRCLLEFL